MWLPEDQIILIMNMMAVVVMTMMVMVMVVVPSIVGTIIPLGLVIDNNDLDT